MSGRNTDTRPTTHRDAERAAGAHRDGKEHTMTHPDYTHPGYNRPADTRPGRDLLDTRMGRAVLAVMVAYVAIAIPVVVLRCVWQFSPLAAVGVAAIGILVLNRKVTNR